ncbi:MAG: hypothetical protein V3U35_03190 [Candidatus Neomarinimicrobiota bacterium]
MKKTLLALGAAGLLLVPTQRAQAIIGFGITGGQDSYSFAGAEYTDMFIAGSGITFTRAEMASPIGGGVYLFIDLIPIIDIEAGANIFFNTFDVTYDKPIGYEEKLGWARTAVYLTIQRKLFKVPMFNLFAGAGLGFHATIPVLDKEFMEEFLGDADATLDVADLEDEIIQATGFHVEVGARFKPILIPFAINVKFRQTFVEGIVPGESSFSTISVGLGFQI